MNAQSESDQQTGTAARQPGDQKAATDRPRRSTTGRSKPQRSRPGGKQIPNDRPDVPVQVEDLVPAPNSQSHGVTDSQTHRPARQPESNGKPGYKDLHRKEARVREDQADALVALRRRIISGRTSREEVITDNTLIRVAIDLLLQHAEQLQGDTEDELRESVTNRRTK